MASLPEVYLAQHGKTVVGSTVAYRSTPVPSPGAGSHLWNFLLVTFLSPWLWDFSSAASGARERCRFQATDGASHPRRVNQ